MVGFSETSRFSYRWILKDSPVFVQLDSQRPPGVRMIRFLGAPGFRIVGFSVASRLSYGWTLDSLG